MAQDNYWVVVFKILNYFYLKMKAGELVRASDLEAGRLKVNEPYLLDIYRNLLDDGYLTGSEVVGYMSGDGRMSELDDFESLRITSKGIEYLEDNDKLKKAYKYLKELKSWIPGMS